MADKLTTDEDKKRADRDLVCVVDGDPVLALVDNMMPGCDGVRAARFAQMPSPEATS